MFAIGSGKYLIGAVPVVILSDDFSASGEKYSFRITAEP